MLKISLIFKKNANFAENNSRFNRIREREILKV